MVQKCLVMSSPRPVPPKRLVVEASAWLNASNSRPSCSRALEKDYSTIGSPIFAVGRTDLPDDLAYQLVKAVFENQPRLLKAHPAASDIVPQNVDKNTFLPFHPGAVRYYREIGTSNPEPLVPTN
jgi:TRAP-type uncharacterized transport system substrate-binding protein